jgi:hypothetical protein
MKSADIPIGWIAITVYGEINPIIIEKRAPTRKALVIVHPFTLMTTIGLL